MDTSVRTLRQDAVAIFKAGIRAADPYQAVKNCLAMNGSNLEIALDSNDYSKIRSDNWTKIHIIAFGKAACGMTKAAVEIIPEGRLAGIPLAISNYENEIVLESIEVVGAGHPLPDLAGQKAAEHIVELLKNTDQDELVLMLISGGGSALVPSPAKGITLADKLATTDLLLASGAGIKQINCVRKHLSLLKGGYLAKLAVPAALHALILSDVLDDDLSTIASGPTVPDNSTFAEAIKILKTRNIWSNTPLAVRVLLEKGVNGNIAETPKSNDPCFEKTSHSLIGSNRISLDAINKTAGTLGYQTDIYSSSLSGEAKKVARQMVLYAKQMIGNALNKATAIIAGGETTVTINGTGKGGRNQEMALAFAIEAKKEELKGKWTFLSGGTDGRDGPTDATGGIVDSETMARLNRAGIDPIQKLNNNDSYSALKESRDLVITGATGTNVADLQVLLIQPV